MNQSNAVYVCMVYFIKKIPYSTGSLFKVRFCTCSEDIRISCSTDCFTPLITSHISPRTSSGAPAEKCFAPFPKAHRLT